jgi:hypothetical protein
VVPVFAPTWLGALQQPQSFETAPRPRLLLFYELRVNRTIGIDLNRLYTLLPGSVIGTMVLDEQAGSPWTVAIPSFLQESAVRGHAVGSSKAVEVGNESLFLGFCAGTRGRNAPKIVLLVLQLKETSHLVHGCSCLRSCVAKEWDGRWGQRGEARYNPPCEGSRKARPLGPATPGRAGGQPNYGYSWGALNY